MSKKRALIVDDSTTAQYRLKKMLRPFDLQIDTVDSGEAALLHLANNVPDVIFMDHLMPGMDGFRALQIIKSHPETAMIPVVMYTSKSGDVYIGQARALGALDVINKDTINATDLSKVMGGIHIYSNKDSQTKDIEIEEIPPRLDISDLPAPSEAAPARTEGVLSDNSRRIELRISQLEHAIDDSRRVITARLIREIQKLRSNMSHELEERFALSSVKTSPAKEQLEEEVIAPPQPPARQDALLPFVTMLLILLVGGFMLNSFNKLNDRLSALSEQQAEQRQQLERVTQELQTAQQTLTAQAERQTQRAISNSKSAVKSSMLNDLVWAFNQSGQIPFHSGALDPLYVQRLSELVYRVGQQGFKGAIWVNLTAGDFCVETNSSGQVELPPADSHMSDCVLLSELYRIESLLDQATDDINNAVTNLKGVNSGDINVIIGRQNDQLVPYPIRQPQLLASEWNKVAAQNNRLVVELSDVDSIQ